MKKLGIAVNNFGANQLACLLIENVNKFLTQHYNIDIIGFYENSIKYTITCNFATMQSVEMWGYTGPTVVTSLNTAHDIINIPSIPKKYFYIWDLEWLNIDGKDYQKLHEIYTNPKLMLLTRNEDYAKLIEQCWNVRVNDIVPDCNIEKLVSIIT